MDGKRSGRRQAVGTCSTNRKKYREHKEQNMNTYQIVAAILAVVVLFIIIARRKKKASQ